MAKVKEFEKDTEFVYKGFGIFFNKWDEYCVLSQSRESMVCYNSGFKTLEQAKEFVKKIYLRSYTKVELEKIAQEIKISNDNGISRTKNK